MRLGSHLDARAARARAAFVELRGEAEAARRAAEIQQLPIVQWRGRTLYTLRCRADFGRGPHDVNVPEHVPWSLIDLRAFRCPYH
jgi:hypothetical protein